MIEVFLPRSYALWLWNLQLLMQFIMAGVATGWESLGSPWANCVLAEVPKVISCHCVCSSSWLGILIDSNQQWLAISLLCLRSEVVNCRITQEFCKYNCSGIGPGCHPHHNTPICLPLSFLAPSYFLCAPMAESQYKDSDCLFLTGFSHSHNDLILNKRKPFSF